MVFPHIEQLKREFTDRYVVVNPELPELQRFRGQTGLVKTVNMSGRALVEFDANANIGWYDIDLEFLKVVDKPVAKEPAAKSQPAANRSRPRRLPQNQRRRNRRPSRRVAA